MVEVPVVTAVDACDLVPWWWWWSIHSLLSPFRSIPFHLVEEALSHPYLARLQDAQDEPVCHTLFDSDFEQPSIQEEQIRELIMMEALAFSPLPDGTR
ncbi:hypothetical protein R1flu_004558 [Riccia fluitans]|uniref:Uncharacterized protein n=1 Tax=Riccia fluitans TaxID=41844 RepID=A0ABD1YQN7_9MARC